jgi:hypothetical protein
MTQKEVLGLNRLLKNSKTRPVINNSRIQSIPAVILSCVWRKMFESKLRAATPSKTYFSSLLSRRRDLNKLAIKGAINRRIASIERDRCADSASPFETRWIGFSGTTTPEQIAGWLKAGSNRSRQI